MSNKSKTIVVTGGAGYVGSTLTGMLIRQGYNVVAVDKLNFGGESILHLYNESGFKLITGDISSQDVLNRVFGGNKIHAVVHLAAIVGDPACSKQPELATATNWEASVKLLDISMKNKVKRFIFASTCSNYGKMPDPEGVVNENSALTPVSLYAQLKVKFENKILNELPKSNDFCPTSLRFTTVFGLSPRMRFDLTVNEFTKDLALGKELTVFGEKFWRPYCHVNDISRAVLTVLEAAEKKVRYNVFNVGDSSLNYQKQMIIDEIGKLIPGIRVKYVQKNEDPRDYRVSFDKIRKELGFKTLKTLTDGIIEIRSAVESGVFINPEDARYKNS
jgi:nucleoside-diphosphate-sugar epimerase